MNETSTMLMIFILAVYFLTSKRFQALVSVVKS